jgi:hypothetical protein
MARPWIDPRDGTRWLIDAIPLDAGPTPGPGASLVGWTLIFASQREHRDLPVGYDLGISIERLRDREIMLLLDAAR